MIQQGVANGFHHDAEDFLRLARWKHQHSEVVQ